MTYTLEQFCENTTQTLAGTPGAAGRDAVRQDLERLLKDKDFVAKYCGPEAEPGIRTIYRCPQTGYNVLIHVYEKGKKGPPHDHGDSWAIYGQAVGSTEMTDWRIVETGDPIRVEAERTYRMEPGDAHFYGVGAVHSPKRADSTRLIRIEGANLDHVQRSNIKAA